MDRGRAMNGVKRKLIQIAAFGFTNFRVGNFAKGTIYTGSWKQFCAPGLNCYSCPAASFACPIGALQTVAISKKMNISFYIWGIILAIGVVLGRGVCGYLCPFGLIEELLYKIKSPKIKLPKVFRYVKYLVLVVFVVALPMMIANAVGIGQPWFCEYICPVGTLEAGIPLLITNTDLRAGIGAIFAIKATILVAVLIFSVLIYRFFCKALCPLGAIYGLLNKVSMLHLYCDKDKCSECGLCAKSCEMDVDPAHESRSSECILCGKCAGTCPSKALRLGFADIKHGNGCAESEKKI